MIGPYQTDYAFRVALEARLRNIAQQQGTDLQRLQRRVAFERLLARLFDADDDPLWLLKGGYALELRLEDRSRSTLDLDLSVPEPARLASSLAGGSGISHSGLIYERLQQAAEGDLGDGFQFLIGSPREQRTGAPGGGVRCSIEARLAGRPFARFHLDVGLGDPVVGPPDWVRGSELLDFAGISAAHVALYPVEQQFAEKVHAYTFPWQDRDNTRVKDLVDLVLLIDSVLLDPDRIRTALRATFEARGSHALPKQLPMPPDDWAESYAALALDLVLSAVTLEDAFRDLNVRWQGWSLGE